MFLYIYYTANFYLLSMGFEKFVQKKFSAHFDSSPLCQKSDRRLLNICSLYIYYTANFWSLSIDF